jgi:hypothetical protein
MKLEVVALGLALGLMAAPGASWAADDRAKADQTAVEVATAMYGAAYKHMLRDALVPQLTEVMSGMMRPEWRGYVAEAVDEELDAGAPSVCAVIGQALAQTATPDELAAGLVAVRDPALQGAMRGLAENQAPPSQPITLSAETRTAMTTPAGRGFTQKVLGNLAKVIDPAKEDLLRAVMPGVLRRLGQKAGLAERRRLKDEGLPVEAAS